ncbi:ABC transporter substrate-binding protein [Georgenia alba]|uniref:ABC transporter substrate-binding protein n=1 Tax=Georgenia alba TaxID=2233858 RepID=A0ABW2QD85_9MICO
MRRARIAAMAAVVAVGVAACAGGGGGDGGADGSDDGLTEVRVGVLPVANMAPLYLGIEEGYFEEEGLAVEPVVSQGGASIVPSVVSGDFQIGYGNPVSIMQARDRGLDIRIVSGSTQGGADAQTSGNGLLVAPDSGIEEVQDLAGKTIAVTTLSNAGELTTRAALEAEGVDSSTVEFVELPFPEMNHAVMSGSVDVAWQAEPFVTLGEDEGMVNIVDPYVATMDHLDAAVYFASGDLVESDPELVAAFQRALTRSMERARQDEDLTRETVLSFTEIEEDVARRMVLAVYSRSVNLESIELQADLALEYGLVENEVDVDALLADGATGE